MQKWVAAIFSEIQKKKKKLYHAFQPTGKIQCGVGVQLSVNLIHTIKGKLLTKLF